MPVFRVRGTEQVGKSSPLRRQQFFRLSDEAFRKGQVSAHRQSAAIFAPAFGHDRRGLQRQYGQGRVCAARRRRLELLPTQRRHRTGMVAAELRVFRGDFCREREIPRFEQGTRTPWRKIRLFPFGDRVRVDPPLTDGHSGGVGHYGRGAAERALQGRGHSPHERGMVRLVSRRGQDAALTFGRERGKRE